MPRGKPQLTPLQARKLLLIAESNLNRARWLEDVSELSDGLRSVATRARWIGSLASSAAVLVGSLMTARSARPSTTRAQPSRWSAILKPAAQLWSLWSKFRASGESRADPAPHQPRRSPS